MIVIDNFALPLHPDRSTVQDLSEALQFYESYRRSGGVKGLPTYLKEVFNMLRKGKHSELKKNWGDTLKDLQYYTIGLEEFLNMES